MDRALESLAQQAAINLVYQPAETQGVKTNGVNATLTPREAVVQLLSGTSLRLNTDEATGAMMISRSDATDSSIRLTQAAQPASPAATTGARTAMVRAEQVVGERDRATGMLNLEWRPTDSLRIKGDSILTESNNNFGQHDVMLTVRSYNNNIPFDFEIDDNNVLTSGTFANAISSIRAPRRERIRGCFIAR